MRIPIIGQADHVILGGSVGALEKAFFLSSHGKKVVLAVSDTFLGTDICSTNRYHVPDEMKRKFPEHVFMENGMLHPDRLKRYLEAQCREKGIRLFYFMWLVDHIEVDGQILVRTASKGGMFGIFCKELLDMRTETKDISYQAYVKYPEADWDFLQVEDVGKVENGTMENLYCCKKALLDKFADFNKNNDLQLGRFALRGYGRPKQDDKRQSKPKKQKDKYRIFAESDFLNYKKYQEVSCCDTVEAETQKAEVLVVGGGTAGVMAAIHAARGGCKTILIEPNYELGGTGTVGGVNTYWFGERFADVQEIDNEIERIYRKLGLNRKAGIWSGHDDFHGGIRGYVYLKLCRQAGVEVLFGQFAYGIVRDSAECADPKDGRLIGVVTSGEYGNLVCFGKVILDATGDGDIAVKAGADYVHGSECDCITYWASLAQYTSPERYKNNFSCMVYASDPEDYTHFIIEGRKRGEMFDHGSYLSMRESRHIKGKYCVTLQDLCMGRTYADGIYTCFSNYDPKGKLNADLVYAGFLPPQTKIQIPLSALLPVDEKENRIPGIYVLGKAVSATHNVFPSIRMQPDLMHQGAVMGMIVASGLKRGMLPEEMAIDEIHGLVREKTGDLLPFSNHEENVADAVDRITVNTRTHWVDVPFTYEETEQNPFLAVLCEPGQESINNIKERINKESKGLLRDYLIACALWHGCDDFTEEFCERICNELEQAEGLPKRVGDITCVQLLPDHGVMPEIIYRLNILACSRKKCILRPFEIVLSKLKASEQEYEEIRKGIYHYVETFSYVAERTGMREFLPMLKELSMREEFQDALGRRSRTDLLTERFLILLFCLYRSAARLGDLEGYEGLLKILEKGGTSLACSACRELENLTGRQFGYRIADWKKEILENPRTKTVQQVTKRYW